MDRVSESQDVYQEIERLLEEANALSLGIPRFKVVLCMLQLAEKVRRDVAALYVPAGDGGWQGSISVGVAVRSANMRSLEDLLKAADMGVYQAKHLGRNCVATGG